MKISALANDQIKRVLLGVPKGHKHLRCILETTDDRVFIFQEATIANLARAYLTLKTHPLRPSVELVGQEVTGKKKDFANFQLLESDTGAEEISEQMNKFFSENEEVRD